MTAVVQRVSTCTLSIDGQIVSRIGQGLLVLLGVAENDTKKDCDALCAKICGLRIFCDENGKMNLSLSDINGQMMIVSNFTLCADCSHGRRPSFTGAARPEQAEPLYERFVETARAQIPVQTGVFGADMKIDLLNDGPVTLVIRSEDLV